MHLSSNSKTQNFNKFGFEMRIHLWQLVKMFGVYTLKESTLF